MRLVFQAIQVRATTFISDALILASAEVHRRGANMMGQIRDFCGLSPLGTAGVSLDMVYHSSESLTRRVNVDE